MSTQQKTLVIMMQLSAVVFGADFYVATNGTDQNPGSFNAPFGTIIKARDTVRTAGDGGTVYIRGGEYNLTSPLTFDTRDNQTTYQAYENEQVLISGGKRITGTWNNEGVKGSGVLWSISIPEVAAGSWWFRDLYFNNDRMQRSRWPNDTRKKRDIGAASTSPYLTMTDFNDNRTRIGIEETLPVDNLSGQNAELVVYYVWGISRNFVESSGAHNLYFKSKGGNQHAVGNTQQQQMRIKDDGHSFKGVHFWPYPSFLEHAFEFLDVPYEWYLQKTTGKLYIIMPSDVDPNSAKIIAPFSKQLVVAHGKSVSDQIEGLNFIGLDFAFTEFPLTEAGFNEQQACHYKGENGKATEPISALELIYVSDCKLQKLKIAHIGGNAISFGAGCKGNVLDGSKIFDVGATGVVVGWVGPSPKSVWYCGWDNDSDTPESNAVTNNLIYDYAWIYKGGVGIWVGITKKSSIEHNEVYGGGYSSITCGWNWKFDLTTSLNPHLNYNDIHHGLEFLSDGGLFYVHGNQPGGQMIGNYMHDTHKSVYAKGWLTNGFYIESGSTGPWSVDMNVVENVPTNQAQFQSVRDPIKPGKNYMDSRYKISSKLATAFNTEYYDVNKKPAEVLQIIKNAGPGDSYNYLYDTDDYYVHSCSGIIPKGTNASDNNLASGEALSVRIASSPSTGAAKINATREERLEWWRDAKLGLFIHWGPASVAGVEISWARMDHPFDHPGHQNMSTEEYDNLYTKFNPVKFDADAWMKLAKEAGFKYVVFTAKHHDGFSNWHTKLRDYSIANTSFKRDICEELSDAAHKYGIRLGWYYSTRDWSHPDYLVGDNKKYNAFYEGQIRELLTDYGKVDIMWFDHVAGNWGDYTIPEMFEMMYSLQGPDLLVNNRGAKFIKRQKGGKYEPDDPELKKMVLGDYDTPEQKVGKFQTDRAWESCMTMTKVTKRYGGGWSYRPDGTTIPYEEVINTLVQSVTGDGNLLLNVGPLPSGEFPADQIVILKRMGQWLNQYGESIYGTRGGPVPNGKWGGSTQKDNKIYVHVLNWPKDGSPLVLPALEKKIIGNRGLNVKEPTVKQTASGIEIDVPVEQRDAIDSIIVLETE